MIKGRKEYGTLKRRRKPCDAERDREKVNHAQEGKNEPNLALQRLTPSSL